MSGARRAMDRRALFTSATAAALLAASGVAAGRPQQGGHLRLALSGGQRSDSWSKGAGLFMQMARQGLVFDTLTELAADGTLRGELAVNWRSSAGGRMWQFDLRPRVRFHDGAALSARDVVHSLTGRLEPGAQLSALSELELRIVLPRPDPGLPLRLADPEFVITAAHAPDSGIGTGLYRVKRFDPGQHLRAERVSSHYKDGRAGWFDTVTLSAISSEAVRRQALCECLVDGADLSDPADLAAMPDLDLWPDPAMPVQAVTGELKQPARISRLRPFDNLRAAERWWFG